MCPSGLEGQKHQLDLDIATEQSELSGPNQALTL
jgi:hypothetical protein